MLPNYSDTTLFFMKKILLLHRLYIIPVTLPVGISVTGVSLSMSEYMFGLISSPNEDIVNNLLVEY